MQQRITALLAGLLLAASVHAASWQEGSSYTAGTTVDYNGKTYTALVSHTAYVGAGWNPASTPTLWQETTSTPQPTATSTPAITASPSPLPPLTPQFCSNPEWVSGKTYQRGDCVAVSYGNESETCVRSYTALKTTSNYPTSNDWVGVPSNNGAGVCTTVPYITPKPSPTATPQATISPTPTPTPPAQGAWDKSIAYLGGQRVSYNGQMYEAKWWTQGDVPGAAEWGPWKLVSSTTATPKPTATPVITASPSPTPMACPALTPPPPIYDAKYVPIYDAAGCVIGWNIVSTLPTPYPTPSATPNVTSSPSPSPTPSTTPAPANDKLLVGYLHASFANGSGYIRMNDVSDKWDFINLSFAEPTSSTSGEVAFKLCPSTECPNVESEADFIAAIKAKQAKGKKVQISIGGANGQVRLETTAAKDAFVRSVAAIIDKYGLDGLDVDFEGHSLQLNAGDNDVANPKAPVIVNLIAALKELKAKYGSKFTLTMAPETFFVQLGYSFYGGTCSGCDTRAGAYLPVIYALRNDLTLLHVQDYNSGPITGLDGVYHTMGNADFHVAMTDMLLKGFKVAGTNFMFPALRPDQIAIGLPANANAGGGFTTVGDVQTALDCLMKGTNCGSYKPGATYPGLRGLMTWSVNWDKFNNFEFSTQHRAYFDKLPK